MSTANPRSRLNPWPYAIIAYFVVFISGLVVWVTFAFHQDMDLVRRDYYEEEMRFQQQMERVRRTQPIRNEVTVGYDAKAGQFTVSLPPGHAKVATGKIHFYRPSDAKLDLDIPLATGDGGVQRIDAKSFRAGLWKVRVNWTVGGQEYFFDQSVVVASHAV